MDIKSFIEKVETMRKLQKSCFRFCNQTLLRKIETLERDVDREIKDYYKDKTEEEQGIFFVNDH